VKFADVFNACLQVRSKDHLAWFEPKNSGFLEISERLSTS